jgi:hypothetical protein
LGHLLNPTDPGSDDRDWIRQVWEGIVREEMKLPHTWSAWVARPALSRLTITSPDLARPFQSQNQGKPYAQQITPFNFLLAAHVKPFGHPAGADPEHFQLFAPFERDASKWLQLPWQDRYTGNSFRVTSNAESWNPTVVQVQTYRDVIEEFRFHPESKSASYLGQPCDRRARGLLRRRRVSTTPFLITHVGKESNKLEEVEARIEHDPDEVFTEYVDPRRDHWQAIRTKMADHRLDVLAEASGISVRQLRNLVAGRARPQPATLKALARALQQADGSAMRS